MANEAVLVKNSGDTPTSMIVADGVGIEKGTLLKLTDPNTAAATAGDEDIFAGIAFGEKIADSGVDMVAVYRKGTFRLIASGAITAGDAVAIKGANLVKAADATCVGSKIIGYALETSAASPAEGILVELNIGTNNAYS